MPAMPTAVVYVPWLPPVARNPKIDPGIFLDNLADRHFACILPMAWPLAFFHDGCTFRGVALRCLIEAGVPHRIALVSAGGQGIQPAVAAELAARVMAEGTLPPGLRVLAEPCGLPDLPQACIQIVTRAQGLSAAMWEVKVTVAETS